MDNLMFDEFAEEFAEEFTEEPSAEFAEEFAEEFTEEFAEEFTPEFAEEFTPEFTGMLDEGLDVEEAESNEYIEFLKSRGYEILDDLEFDDLEFLCKRERSADSAESADNVNGTLFTQSRRIQMQKLQSTVMNSKSLVVEETDRKEFENAQIYNYITQSEEYSALDHAAFGVVLRLYLDGVSVSEITPEKVLVELRSDDPQLLSPFASVAVLRDHLATIIPNHLLTLQNAAEKSAKNTDELAAKRLIAFLEEDSKVWESVDARSVALIKQVYEYEGNYAVKCAECGEMIEFLSFPETIIAIPLNKERSTGDIQVMTHPIKCKCGKVHSFFLEDYVSVYKTVYEAEGSALHSRIQKSTKSGEGCTLITYKPSAKYVKDAIPAIIISTQVPFKAAKPVNEETLLTIVNSRDMLDASKQLYQQIYAMSCTSDASTLSKIAYFVCMCAGRDYRIEINKALFTLAEFISENEVLRRFLDASEIHRMQSQYNVFRYYLDRLDNSSIVSLCNALNREKGLHLSSNAPDIKDTLTQECRIFLRELEVRITEAKANYDFAIDNIRKNKEAFFYLDSDNSSQLVSEIQQFVYTDRAFELYTELANGMVLTNFSDKFYDFWITLKNVNATHLNKILFESAYTGSTPTYVKNTIAKMCASLRIDDKFDHSRFYPCYSMTDNYSVCHRVMEDLQACDYSAFLRDVKDYYKSGADTVIQKRARTSLYRSDVVACAFTDSADSSLSDFEKFRSIGGVLFEIIGDCMCTLKKRGDAIKFAFMNAILLGCADSYREDEFARILGISSDQLRDISIAVQEERLSWDVEMGNDTYAILHGEYFSSVDEYIDILASKYDSLTVFDFDDVASKINDFNFKAQLMNLLNPAASEYGSVEVQDKFAEDGGLSTIVNELMLNSTGEKIHSILRKVPV